MSKVVFQSEQAFLHVSHERLFHCGVITPPHRAEQGMKISCSKNEAGVFGAHIEDDGVDYEKLKEMGIPACKRLYTGYVFAEGEAHNQLTLETEEEITAMREHIKDTDNSIVELDAEGNFPAEPEGTPFIANTPHKVLTPAMYCDSTTAEGKTFRFNMGIERNKYITADAEEIATIRGYIKSHSNTGISDPTYKDPLAEA